MTSELLLNDAGDPGLPLWLLNETSLPGWLDQQPVTVAGWVRANAFQAERQRVLVLPGEAGQVGGRWWAWDRPRGHLPDPVACGGAQ